MGIILEIKAGSYEGKEIPLPNGQSLLVGRTSDRAQFAVPHDNYMSGLHFAVECGAGGCRVIDRKDTRYLSCSSVRER